MCKPDRGGNTVLAVAAVAAVPAAGLLWLVTSTPLVVVCLVVLAVACTAGVGVVVRNIVRDWGVLWRGESESLLRSMLRIRRRVVRPAKRLALPAVPSPAALAVRPPAAITAPRVVAGEVISRSEKVEA